AELIEKFTNEEINLVQQGGKEITLDNEQLVVTEQDIEIYTDEIPGYEVASKGSLTVALDISLTEELIHEGNARELVNRIQNLSKDLNFDLTDRISLHIIPNETLQPSLIQFKDYICREILADDLV